MNKREAAKVKTGDRVSYFHEVGTVVQIISKEDYKGSDVDRIRFPLFKVRTPGMNGSLIGLITYAHQGLKRLTLDPKKFDSCTN